MSKVLYEKANKFVEKWTMFVHYFLSKVAVPCIMSVFIILSYALYFETDLKKEAFYLPYAVWYAMFYPSTN